MKCSELEEKKIEEITRLFYEIIDYLVVQVEKSEKDLIAIKLAKMVEVARRELIEMLDWRKFFGILIFFISKN
ncbi:MAG: hypothetical protein CL921_04390 [Deltaproteobacteria bacterium]|nr:hypothetical protein [Deltaproteobacteria bacterium]